MATIIATVAEGLEECARAELEELGVTTSDTARGAVLASAPEFPSPRGWRMLGHLNRWGRGIDRVGILLVRATVSTLDDCYEAAAALDYRPFFARDQSFAVRAHRRGEHDFGSLDLARVVGKAVVDSRLESDNVKPPVSLDDPDIILRAELADRSFRLWLDVTGDEPLYRRDYRRQLHPASMRASMAHLLVRHAGWAGEPLLDPMTGIGTIPIEAALYARGVAPGTLRRRPCALERLTALLPPPPATGRDGDAQLVVPGPLVAASALDLRGIERYEHHVQGAWLNLAAAGAPRGVRLQQGDACRLDKVLTFESYPLAVLNPPFGRRVGSTGMVADLYRRFARSAFDRGVRRIVALAENRRLMADSLRQGGYEIDRMLPVLYGDLPVTVVVAKT